MIMVSDPRAWPAGTEELIAQSMARGMQLARRDRYAWVASDRVLESAAAREGLGGYVIEERGPESATVHFVRDADAGLVSALRVTIDPATPEGVLQLPGDQPIEDDAPLAQSWRASSAARSDSNFVAKWPSYNVDAVPWSANPAEGWAVYLIPSATDYAHVPLGGGYRAHVSADGRRVESFDPLSNAVVEFPIDQEGLAMVTASILTPVPNESYFAWAYTWHRPLTLVTPDVSVWMIVEGGVFWGALPPEG